MDMSQRVVFDLMKHLRRQKRFSEANFGPYNRSGRIAGVIDHIRKELVEIEAAPFDLEEWIDLIILALDGAMSAGHEPVSIVAMLEFKQDKNEKRKWPDWRDVAPGKAIEHVRGVDMNDIDNFGGPRPLGAKANG